MMNKWMRQRAGDPLRKGTSAEQHLQSKGKEPTQVVSSSERTSTTVSYSSHGGGDGGDEAGDSGTCATSKYYQLGEEDAIHVEDV